jgi:filamentous hemagglutinin
VPDVTGTLYPYSQTILMQSNDGARYWVHDASKIYAVDKDSFLDIQRQLRHNERMATDPVYAANWNRIDNATSVANAYSNLILRGAEYIPLGRAAMSVVHFIDHYDEPLSLDDLSSGRPGMPSLGRRGGGLGSRAAQAQVKPPPGAPPPNLSPPGANRRGALNEAKRMSGVPTSQQPSRSGPNVNRNGERQPGRMYEYDVPQAGGGTRTVTIRDDSAGHYFKKNDPQNRGPHFNDEGGNHFDYKKKGKGKPTAPEE